MRVSTFLACCFALTLAACSSAENEAPVDLKPGQYEVIISGLNRNDGTKSLCFLPDEAASFPADPLKKFISDLDDCEDHGDRKGNALKGSMNCKIKIADMEAEYTANWTGRLHPEAFELNGDSLLKGPNAPEGNRTTIAITGKRVGDCFS